MKKIIILFALMVFLFVPILSSAQTAVSSDQITQQLIQLLQETIVRLQQQIADILAKQSTTTTVNQPTTVTSTGSLSLVKDDTYPSQPISTPQINFKLADFTLANKTSETVTVSKIENNLIIGSFSYVMVNPYITGLYIAYGDNKTTVLNTVSGKNSWTVSFQLVPNQTIDLSLYGNINSSIPLNSVINTSILVSGVSVNSKTNLYTNSNLFLSGQTITVGTGSLTISKDGTTPSEKIYAINQRIIAGKFKFTGTNDSYNISELKFVVPNTNTSSAVTLYPPILDAVLLDSATQEVLSKAPVKVFHNGSDFVLDFSVNISVPLNSSKSITVYYDLPSSIDLYNTNANIAPILVYAAAVSSKGNIIDGSASDYHNFTASYGKISLPSSGVTVNGVYVFKSVPIFKTISSASHLVNNSENNLYTFSIGADAAGSVSVKQITLKIKVNSSGIGVPHLTNFKLYKGNSNYTSSVSLGNVLNNNNYIGLTGDAGIGVGDASTVVITFNEEELVSAGTTQIYTLKATAGSFSFSDSISISFEPDSRTSAGGRYLGTIFSKLYYGLTQTNIYPYTVIYYSFLWSDMSEALPNQHTIFNGLYTKDWYNGFGAN